MKSGDVAVVRLAAPAGTCYTTSIRARIDLRSTYRGVAILLLLGAATSVGLFFATWHLVQRESIDLERLFAAFYFGPDAHLSDELRARWLSEGLHAGVTTRACTGIEHLGRAPLGALMILGTLAAAAVFAPRRWTTAIGVACIGAALAARGLACRGEFMRHILEHVGPDAWTVAVFELLGWACAALAVVLVGSSLAQEPPARSTPRASPARAPDDGVHSIVTGTSTTLLP